MSALQGPQGLRQAHRELSGPPALGPVPPSLRTALAEEHRQEGAVQDQAHQERPEAPRQIGEFLQGGNSEEGGRKEARQK